MIILNSQDMYKKLQMKCKNFTELQCQEYKLKKMKTEVRST